MNESAGIALFPLAPDVKGSIATRVVADARADKDPFVDLTRIESRRWPSRLSMTRWWRATSDNPSSPLGVVAQRPHVGNLGLEDDGELGGGDEVGAVFADVGVGAGLGDELAGAVPVGDGGLEHLRCQPLDLVGWSGPPAGRGERDPGARLADGDVVRAIFPSGLGSGPMELAREPPGRPTRPLVLCRW